MAAVISSLLAKRVRGATGTVCLCGTVGGEGQCKKVSMTAEITGLKYRASVITRKHTRGVGCGFSDGVLSLGDGLEDQIPVGLLGWRERRSETKQHRSANNQILISIAL